MSVQTTISIQDHASPAIRARVAALSPRRLNAAIGPACLRLTQRNFRSLPSNKMGWPTTNFWSRASKASFWVTAPEGVMLSVNQIGVRQRWLGGPVSPTNKGALTIPIDARAYGHVASDFPGIFCLRTKDKGAFLVIGKEPDLIFLFKLSGGVNQAPNPAVMPTREAYAAEAGAAVLRAVKAPGATT